MMSFVGSGFLIGINEIFNEFNLAFHAFQGTFS